MRSRTVRDGPFTGVTEYIDSLGNAYYSIETVIDDQIQTMNDVVTPGYHAAIKRGAIINNPCSYESTSVKAGGGSARAVQTSNPLNFFEVRGGSVSKALYYQYGGSWDMSSLADIDTVRLRDVARQKAIASIDATPYAFMEDIFEIRETLRFLRNPFGAWKNISKKYKRYVKKREKLGRSHADAIADAWLEYRFAITPLVRSIDDAFHLLANTPKRRPARLSARGKYTDSSTSSGELQSTYLEGNRSVSRKAEARCSILYEVANPASDFRFHAGLRAKDIPATLWAVMPWSFMVDRVSNISDTIQGITNLTDPNVRILAGSDTLRQEELSSWRITAWENSAYDISMSGDQVNETSFSYTRDPYIPSISDTFVKPSLDGLVKDATYITDLCALILRNVR